MSNDILIHHGIKGMKWGVRRYQNPDGTLTERGRKKYAKRYSAKIEKQMRNITNNAVKRYALEQEFAKYEATGAAAKHPRKYAFSKSNYEKQMMRNSETAAAGARELQKLLKEAGDIGLTTETFAVVRNGTATIVDGIYDVTYNVPVNSIYYKVS